MFNACVCVCVCVQDTTYSARLVDAEQPHLCVVWVCAQAFGGHTHVAESGEEKN